MTVPDPGRKDLRDRDLINTHTRYVVLAQAIHLRTTGSISIRVKKGTQVFPLTIPIQFPIFFLLWVNIYVAYIRRTPLSVGNGIRLFVFG